MIEWLISFTDDELEAIYTAIEIAPYDGDWRYENLLKSVLDKITPAAVGNSRPAGAVNE